MSEEQKRRGVVCSSAGNHAQGVALAAKIHGIRAVVCMADERHAGQDRGDERLWRRGRAARRRSGTRQTRRRRSSCATEGLTYVHPFDDEQLIAGQGTLGLEIVQDWPEVDAVVVPIGGGGLISGVSMAVKSHNPKIRVIGVESSRRAGDAAQRRGGQARDDRLPDDHRRAARAARRASSTSRSCSASSTRSSRCRTARSSTR